MKMAGSARSTLLLSEIVPPTRALLRGIFEEKSLPKWISGGFDDPAWEKDAPRPSPNQSLLSRTAGLVSVLRVTDDCDEKGRASDCGSGSRAHAPKRALARESRIGTVVAHTRHTGPPFE